jgi:CRP/FNR family transcriptional regulator, anaerobic regulatory protein
VNTAFDIQCDAATCRPEAGDDCAAHGTCALRAFARTDPSVFDRITKQRRVFRRGEILFHAGQPFSYVCAIRSGSVKSYLCSEEGDAQVTGFWFAGELLDLNGIHHDSRACVVEALEMTSVCELPTDFLKQLLSDVPAARIEMLKNMSAQVHNAEELIRVSETKRADQRVAVFLLEMSRRVALRGLSDREIRLAMSHTDLASFLGMARETLSRALSRFDAEGLVTGRGEVLLINDPDALRTLARG